MARCFILALVLVAAVVCLVEARMVDLPVNGTEKGVPPGCTQHIGCGGVMTSIDGVDAYSNGADQCTGNCCGGNGAYGCQYQCVELAQRYFAKKYGIQDNWWVPYAKDLCDSHPKGVSKTSSPAHGDLIVFDWAPYGHVAVIDTVTSSQVAVVEQNNMPDGRNTYDRSEAYCFLTAK